MHAAMRTLTILLKNLCWTVAVSPGPRQHTSARGRGSCPTATLRYARGADERWRWSSCHQLCSGLRPPWVVACWSFPESDARVHPLLASAICGVEVERATGSPRQATQMSSVRSGRCRVCRARALPTARSTNNKFIYSSLPTWGARTCSETSPCLPSRPATRSGGGGAPSLFIDASAMPMWPMWL